jgi:hypothetical protein
MEASSAKRREVWPRRDDSRLIRRTSSRMGSRLKLGKGIFKYRKGYGVNQVSEK